MSTIGNDFIQNAKDLARAEKKLNIKPWVVISLERQLVDGTNERLYHYDLPREMLKRWMWVISWRRAKFQCKYPRSHLSTNYHYYDKHTGLETGFGTLLYKLSAAKAQITKVERTIAGYIEYKYGNNLFFNSETDEILLMAKSKLQLKKENYNNMLALLEQEIEINSNNLKCI